MRLDDSIYEYIKEEVIDLFVRYDVKCVPISGFELATKMGMTMIAYSSLSFEKLVAANELSQDGFYMESDGKEYIYYNDKMRYGRCNMTILHEIGHAVLGHTENMNPEKAESEASFFAKYASAPPPLVNKIHPINPEKIAEVFGISYEAACNAMNYYQKWLCKFSYKKRYLTYEKKLMNLFNETA